MATETTMIPVKIDVEEKDFDNLDASIKQLGQLRANLVCKQHPNRILAGRHRSAKGATRKVMFDVDAKARELGVSHALAEIMIQMHDNVQRRVSEDERRQEFLLCAVQAKEDGIPDSEISSYLANKILPYSAQYIGKLLPAEFKNLNKARDQSEKPDSQNDKAQPERSTSTHTTAAQMLEAAFSYWGLHPDNDFTPFIREGEFTDDGKPKTYTPDFWFPGKHPFIVEAMGEGSSSDEPARLEFFKQKGIIQINIPNKMAMQFAPQVAQMIYLLVHKDD